MSASIASCSPPTSRISKTNGPIPGRSSTRSTPTSRQRINARSGSATPSNSSSSVIDRAPPHPDPLPASGAREKAPRPALAGRGRDPRQREDEGQRAYRFNWRKFDQSYYAAERDSFGEGAGAYRAQFYRETIGTIFFRTRRSLGFRKVLFGLERRHTGSAWPRQGLFQHFPD